MAVVAMTLQSDITRDQQRSPIQLDQCLVVRHEDYVCNGVAPQRSDIGMPRLLGHETNAAQKFRSEVAQVVRTAGDIVPCSVEKRAESRFVSSLNLEPCRTHWSRQKCVSNGSPGIDSPSSTDASDGFMSEVITCTVGHGPFGVDFEWDAELEALIVEAVVGGSVAEQHGILIGDELTHVAGVSLSSFADARGALAQPPPFTLTFERDCQGLQPDDFLNLSGFTGEEIQAA